MFRLIILLSAILSINGCKTSKSCVSPFKAKIENLIEMETNFSVSYKEKQLDNKTRIIDNLCTHFGNRQRVLIVDFTMFGAKGFYGAVFVYNSDLVFSYKQEAGRFKIKDGYEFDRNGSMEKIISLIKDSTIQKLSKMESSKSHLTDTSPINIFYLNDINKEFKLYRLSGDQIFPYQMRKTLTD